MLISLIDAFVPPALRSDTDQLLRARILAAALLTLVIQETLVFALLLLEFPTNAILYGGSLTLLEVAGSAALLLHLRRTGAYRFCSVAATLLTLALVASGIYVSGGLPESPVTQLLVIPLLMAFFFGGLRWGGYAAVVTLGVAVLLQLLYNTDIRFPQTIGEGAQMHTTRLLISAISFVFITGMAVAYEYVAIRLRRERDHEQERYKRLARIDPLTGLANRRNFDATLDERARSCGDAEGFVLGYLDLDGFKPINDRYGHAVGDEVLRIVSDRLRSALRSAEFVGRYGGDEFMLILEAQSNAAHFEQVAQRVLSAIEQPISTSKGIVTVGGSIGFAHFPQHGAEVDHLVQAADVAMYAAKRQRLGWCIYNPELRSSVYSS
jgi:diguanylate cyclase (GGDEF)-like protein